MKKIAIIMGSDSDLPVLEGAIKTLHQFDVPCEVRVLSAHRTPLEAADFARSAREKGFGAIIAAAGKAAHLAGAMAAGTTLPVIGIPVKSSTLDGLDALRADALRHAGCHRRHRRRGECRPAGHPDPGRFRRGAG